MDISELVNTATLECRACSETFETLNSLKYHIAKVHQTKTELKFGYGIKY